MVIELYAIKQFAGIVRLEVETLKEIRDDLKSSIKRLNQALLELEQKMDEWSKEGGREDGR
jgi:prefoldin subunit 5